MDVNHLRTAGHSFDACTCWNTQKIKKPPSCLFIVAELTFGSDRLIRISRVQQQMLSVRRRFPLFNQPSTKGSPRAKWPDQLFCGDENIRAVWSCESHRSSSVIRSLLGEPSPPNVDLTTVPECVDVLPPGWFKLFCRFASAQLDSAEINWIFDSSPLNAAASGRESDFCFIYSSFVAEFHGRTRYFIT